MTTLAQPAVHDTDEAAAVARRRQAGVPAPPRDVLLFGMTQTPRFQHLLEWAQAAPHLHGFVPDFHRLQIEHWIWSRRERLQGVVLDVGVQSPRRWVGAGYRTMGFSDCDLAGDLCAMPLPDASVDAVLLTEVLEHCDDPFTAVREVHRVLKPGGLLLVTSPFLWPWHGTDDYPDYWRFTADGWRRLLRAYRDVSVHACQWTDEGAQAYELMRRFECMGHAAFVHAHTGYLCEAVK